MVEHASLPRVRRSPDQHCSVVAQPPSASSAAPHQASDLGVFVGQCQVTPIAEEADNICLKRSSHVGRPQKPKVVSSVLSQKCME